jgi:hypothetical protein
MKVVLVYVSLVIAVTLGGSVTGDYIKKQYEVNR